MFLRITSGLCFVHILAWQAALRFFAVSVVLHAVYTDHASMHGLCLERSCGVPTLLELLRVKNGNYERALGLLGYR